MAKKNFNYDYTTKVCMAANWISDGKNPESYFLGATSQGDVYSKSEKEYLIETAQNTYNSLSEILSDEGIQNLATILNER